MYRSIKEDIAAYVKNGGRDAFAFSLTHSPAYDDVPGEEIQRIIDEEAKRLIMEESIKQKKER